MNWLDCKEIKPPRIGVYYTLNARNSRFCSSVWLGRKWVQIKHYNNELFYNHYPKVTHWARD